MNSGNRMLSDLIANLLLRRSLLRSHTGNERPFLLLKSLRARVGL